MAVRDLFTSYGRFLLMVLFNYIFFILGGTIFVLIVLESFSLNRYLTVFMDIFQSTTCFLTILLSSLFFIVYHHQRGSKEFIAKKINNKPLFYSYFILTILAMSYSLIAISWWLVYDVCHQQPTLLVREIVNFLCYPFLTGLLIAANVKQPTEATNKYLPFLMVVAGLFGMISSLFIGLRFVALKENDSLRKMIYNVSRDECLKIVFSNDTVTVVLLKFVQLFTALCSIRLTYLLSSLIGNVKRGSKRNEKQTVNDQMPETSGEYNVPMTERLNIGHNGNQHEEEVERNENLSANEQAQNAPAVNNPIPTKMLKDEYLFKELLKSMERRIGGVIIGILLFLLTVTFASVSNLAMTTDSPLYFNMALGFFYVKIIVYSISILVTVIFWLELKGWGYKKEIKSDMNTLIIIIGTMGQLFVGVGCIAIYVHQMNEINKDNENVNLRFEIAGRVVQIVQVTLQSLFCIEILRKNVERENWKTFSPLFILCLANFACFFMVLIGSNVVMVPPTSTNSESIILWAISTNVNLPLQLIHRFHGFTFLLDVFLQASEIKELQIFRTQTPNKK